MILGGKSEKIVKETITALSFCINLLTPEEKKWGMLEHFNPFIQTYMNFEVSPQTYGIKNSSGSSSSTYLNFNSPNLRFNRRRIYQYSQDSFRFKFLDFYQDFKQHGYGYTYILTQREAVNNCFTLFTCRLKKLVNNQNNRKVVFIVLI